METAITIAITSALWFFVVGNAAAAVLGLLALASPGALRRLSRHANAWVSSRKLGKPLAVEIHAENAVLHYPRTSGTLVSLGSAFVLLAWGRLVVTQSSADGGRLIRELLGLTGTSQAVAEIIWLSFACVVLMGAALGLVLGLLTLRRSKLLERVRTQTDRSVSTRAWTKSAETAHSGTDHWITSHLRLWGGVVAALSVFVLINLVPILR